METHKRRQCIQNLKITSAQQEELADDGTPKILEPPAIREKTTTTTTQHF